jgi:hypothetical protein
MITDNVDWMDVEDHGASTGNGYAPHTCDGGYKGREQREGYTTIVTDEDTPKTEYVNFIQLGRGEYVVFDEAQYAVVEEGQTDLYISGKTNSPSLAFSVNGAFVELPTTFNIVVDGVETYNQDTGGQVFADDPGATQEFAFNIEVDVSENTNLGQRSCILTATGSAGVTATTEIVQEGGLSYINVTDSHLATTTVTFDHNGESGGEKSVDVNVYSNDNWSVDLPRVISIVNSDWFRLDDHGDNSGDGMITVSRVAAHSGRTQRSKAATLTTFGGASATVVVAQTGQESIVVDGFVNAKDVLVETIPSSGGLFYLVGKANCALLDAEETTSTGGTDLNEQGGNAHESGYILVESLGTPHSGVVLGMALDSQGLQDYGAANAYTFKIPVVFDENETTDPVVLEFEVSNGDDVTDAFHIRQDAAPTPVLENT